MSNRIIESNSESSNIYRIRESSFDTEVFTSDRIPTPPDYTGIPGLFDFSDVLSYSGSDTSSSTISVATDVWNIRDKAHNPPTPLVVKNECFMPGFVCEKPSYLNYFRNSEFYPMGNTLGCVNSGDYMDGYLDPSDIFDALSGGSVIFGGDETYAYSREVNISYRGASSNGLDNINILRFDNGEISWENNWSPKASLIDKGLFFSGDTVQISGSSVFNKIVQLESSGTYCFSLYARISDELIGSDGDSNPDDRLNESAEGSLNLSIRGVSKTFNLNTFWKRVFLTFSVSGPEQLNLSISSSSPNPVRICALLMEKNEYPTPYDKRWISYDSDEGPGSHLNKYLYYPLAFKSFKIGEGNWSVVYKRFLETPETYSGPLLDRIGDLVFGYRGGKAVAEKASTGETLFSLDVDLSKFLNREETVFVLHESGSGTVTIKVYNSLGETYSLENVSLSSYEIDYDDTVIIKPNILLGGQNLKIGGYGYYKDMCINSSYFTREDIDRILGDCFDTSLLDSFESVRYHYFVPDSSVTKSWEEIFNLESAEIGDSYKLSNDSPEELGYKRKDVLVCVKGFDSSIDITVESFPYFWSRTPMISDRKLIEDQVVFRAEYIREGYIGE